MFNQLNNTFEEGIQGILVIGSLIFSINFIILDLISTYKIDTTNASNNSNNNNNNTNNNSSGNNTVLADQLRHTVQTLLDVTSSMSSNIVETQNKLLASHQGNHKTNSTPQLNTYTFSVSNVPPQSTQKGQPQAIQNQPQHPQQQLQQSLPTLPHASSHAPPTPSVHPSSFAHNMPPTNPLQQFTVPASPAFPPNTSMYLLYFLSLFSALSY